MKLHAIIRPIVFTRARLLDRGYHWVAEWIGLFSNIIYIVTFGYCEPCWKFSFLTYIRRLGPQPIYDNQGDQERI